MIVCKQCGHHNEDNDTFCGSCGKFLEWTGERVAVAEPEPPPPVAEPEPEPVHLGLIDRVKQAVGIEETAPNGQTAVDPDPTPVAPAAAAPLRSVPVSSAPAATTAPEPVLAGVATPGPPQHCPGPAARSQPTSRSRAGPPRSPRRSRGPVPACVGSSSQPGATPAT